VGIEPSAFLLENAQRIVADSGVHNVELRPQPVEELDDAALFDLVVLDNVLEHLPRQHQALTAMVRALRPGGVLYIVVPNKLWPLEVHYRLPFLSYLPLPLANRYLRLTGRGTDYADASYAPTYGRLVRLLRSSGGLDVHFVLPADLSLTQTGNALHYRVGAALLRRMPLLWRISKAFLVVAVKSI
jgi:SAM-dependent methyltransferase